MSDRQKQDVRLAVWDDQIRSHVRSDWGRYSICLLKTLAASLWGIFNFSSINNWILRHNEWTKTTQHRPFKKCEQMTVFYWFVSTDVLNKDKDLYVHNMNIWNRIIAMLCFTMFIHWLKDDHLTFGCSQGKHTILSYVIWICSR